MLPVVILAAGRGVRLGPLGQQFNKALLPIGDGTLLTQHVRVFAELGASRFVVVVEAATGALVADEARRAVEPWGAQLEVVLQHRASGIGDAAKLGGIAVQQQPFVLVLGDTYYVPRDLAGAVAQLRASGLDAVLSVRRVDDEALIRRECTIALDDHGLVRTIVEKPQVALSALKPCGIYFLGTSVLEAIQSTPSSPLRGEVELTDALQRLIARGGRIGVHETLITDVNITHPLDLVAANLDWLTRHGGTPFVHPEAMVDEGAHLERSVVGRRARVGMGARVLGSVVFPGAEVPPDAQVVDALVTPTARS
jgi:dTDP-glucose pyrophosphorylase